MPVGSRERLHQKEHGGPAAGHRRHSEGATSRIPLQRPIGRGPGREGKTGGESAASEMPLRPRAVGPASSWRTSAARSSGRREASHFATENRALEWDLGGPPRTSRPVKRPALPRGRRCDGRLSVVERAACRIASLGPDGACLRANGATRAEAGALGARSAPARGAGSACARPGNQRPRGAARRPPSPADLSEEL